MLIFSFGITVFINGAAYKELLCDYLHVYDTHLLADDVDDVTQLQHSAVSAADVVLCGLNIIVPLMTAELLKVLVCICF